MDTPDATTFGQLIVKLQLATPAEVEESMDEAREETGGRMPDLQRFLRVRSSVARPDGLPAQPFQRSLPGQLRSQQYL